MKLLVQRTPSDGTATLGELLIDNHHECWTLEPASPIPAGTYDLIISWSPRFQRLLPLVVNVPGHEGIRIHWGNWAKDTEDCLLVGTTKGVDFVGHSVDEFNTLFKKLQDEMSAGGSITITYQDTQYPDVDGEITV